MIARIWKSALALGAVLVVSGAARADDRETQRLTGNGSTGSTTMTLGGKGTVQQNATGDTELTHGFHHGWGGGWGGHHGWSGGWGGYRGWGGGWGWGGWGGGWGSGWGVGWGSGWGVGWGSGWGGWGGGWGVYNSFYRPYYGSFWPYYGGYYGSFYRPVSSSYFGFGGCGCRRGFYLGISGGAGTGAPAVNLGSLSTPITTTQTIAGKAAIPAPPVEAEYRYKAYGEK